MKDYDKSFKILADNFFKFKNYRRMHPVLAVIIGILMLPFTLAGLLMLGLLYVYYYFFKLLVLPADYLMGIIRNEGKEVKHATQAVIYLIGFPFAFVYYALIAFEIIGIHILYIVTFVYLYFASLCGFRFKPILLTSDDDIEIEQRPKYNVAIPVVFIVVVLVIIAAFVLTWIFVDPIVLYQYRDPITRIEYTSTFSVHNVIYEFIPLFYLIYIPLAFGHKSKKVVEVVEEKPVDNVVPPQDNNTPQQ